MNFLEEGIDFPSEALRLTPITEYPFDNPDLLSQHLNHGFEDLDHLFPSWQVFLDRSEGKVAGIERYMAYLLCRPDEEIMGVVAVQLSGYEALKSKVRAIVPDIPMYLYLSWIALDVAYQKTNYFNLLFEFYHALIRRFRQRFKVPIEGAAVAIRRMRPVLWALLNTEEVCPSSTSSEIYKETSRVNFLLIPGETFNPELEPLQDHLLIIFNAPL